MPCGKLTAGAAWRLMTMARTANGAQSLDLDIHRPTTAGLSGFISHSVPAALSPARTVSARSDLQHRNLQ
jgi:hypothetical protein